MHVMMLGLRRLELTKPKFDRHHAHMLMAVFDAAYRTFSDNCGMAWATDNGLGKSRSLAYSTVIHLETYGFFPRLVTMMDSFETRTRTREHRVVEL